LTEQRRFTRIPFSAIAHLHSGQTESYRDCQVLDLSLNGLLMQIPQNWQGKLGQSFSILLQVSDDQIEITMQAKVAHISSTAVGFQCQQIDLDSISHLKKLIALNLGDERLLDRQLLALTQSLKPTTS
jgi:hypothetical protein